MAAIQTQCREPMPDIERPTLERASLDQSFGALPKSVVLLAGSRPPSDTPVLYEKAGPFEIRLAASTKDLRQAQRLRYTIFFEEGHAVPDEASAKVRRDLCAFDAICDHLVVVDTRARRADGAIKPKLVGTYRVLRREIADAHNGFYSEGEFDLAPLLARHPATRFLELGRSCVHPDYRSKRVIELLWRGLYLYARHFQIDALIGCASLPGVDLDALRLPLSFLLQNAGAEPDWQVAALPRREAEFTPLAEAEIDVRRALGALPPLVKAYMRTGARFGRHAVVDHQFGTTDVFAIMPMNAIEDRYLSHYAQPSCLSSGPVA